MEELRRLYQYKCSLSKKGPQRHSEEGMYQHGLTLH